MAKYRKKVLVEAIQWNGEDVPGLEKECYEDDEGISRLGLLIPTLEGTLRMALGDYLLTGSEGERWPCREDIFLKTYELAE